MRTLVTLLSVVCMALGLTGCNTIEGMGKDIRKAGEKIERSAK
ncbi:MAG: entericidin A/B family lipoprotein [Burkholderiales bacterium]|nr:entericidin A/B family lipoprotein [Burkholderiales bacterium]